jgi:hypothetical protein
MNKVMRNQRKKLEIVTQDMEIHEEGYRLVKSR